MVSAFSESLMAPWWVGVGLGCGGWNTLLRSRELEKEWLWNFYQILVSIRSNKIKKARQVYNGPRTSNYLSNNNKIFWSKMIFEQQNLKKNSEKKFFGNKFEKNYWKKMLKFFYQLQVTIPTTHPVQISSRPNYCITLS